MAGIRGRHQAARRHRLAIEPSGRRAMLAASDSLFVADLAGNLASTDQAPRSRRKTVRVAGIAPA